MYLSLFFYFNYLCHFMITNMFVDDVCFSNIKMFMNNN